MGVEDILYDLIKEYRKSQLEKQKTKENSRKQLEIAKSIVKKTYLRFNFDWVTEKNKDALIDDIVRTKHELFKHYSQVFLDIAVEIFDILPEESEKLKNMARGMKSGVVNRNYKDLISIGDYTAENALKNFHDLNNQPAE